MSKRYLTFCLVNGVPHYMSQFSKKEVALDSIKSHYYMTTFVVDTKDPHIVEGYHDASLYKALRY